MGRRDAVQVVLEVNARCRHYLPSLAISYSRGWESAGNGQRADYAFGNVHHTGSATSFARPFPTQGLLENGRSDLSGPLTNYATPACTVDAPRLHVVAANPANHAGAARASGPVPASSLYNPKTLGNEIDYAGSSPMLAGQLLVGHVWSRAVADVLGNGNVEVVRAHAETSITGKWDPGYSPGRTINMAEFRAAARALTPQAGDDSMSAQDVQNLKDWIAGAIGKPFSGFRSDPKQKSPDGKVGTGQMVLAAPGYWVPIPHPDYVSLYQSRGVVGGFANVPPNEFEHFRALFLAPISGAVDSGKLAAQLRALLPAAEATQINADLKASAKAVADEMDARARARLDRA